MKRKINLPKWTSKLDKTEREEVSKLYDDLAYLEGLISFFLKACEQHRKHGRDVHELEFEAKAELVKKGVPIIDKIYSYGVKQLKDAIK